MNEPLKNYREEPDTRRGDASKLRDAMATLLASEGWRMLEKILSTQSSTRQHQLLQPLASGDSMYAQEYKKGEAAAFRVAASLPETLRRSAEETLSALIQKEEEEPPQREDHIEEEIEDV